MGTTIVTQFVTLDGVVEDPDGRGGTAFGGWALRGAQSVPRDRFALGDSLSTGVLLFGRSTWEHFGRLWPTREFRFATVMNEAAKAVVTHRPLDPEQWRNSSAVEGSLADWIAATTATRDVVVIGSISVVRALAELDLVDEYRLLVVPTVTVEGERLFDRPVALELASVERSDDDALAIYRRPAR